MFIERKWKRQRQKRWGCSHKSCRALSRKVPYTYGILGVVYIKVMQDFKYPLKGLGTSPRLPCRKKLLDPDLSTYCWGLGRRVFQWASAFVLRKPYI